MHYHGMPAAHLMGWFRRRLPGFDWFPNRTVLVEKRLTLSLPLPLPLTPGAGKTTTISMLTGLLPATSG